jgi:serine/threonine protein kinase
MALSSLRHENIVAVENAGLTEDGRVFIAMELLRGKTLRASLAQRGTLSQEETISLMLGVASGVSAAHEGGVIHRDLKPENIFCVLHGSVKVLDFGTAKFGGDNAPSIQTALGRVVGTVAYMAPERFEGSVGDVRSDVYALGLITYECLAGFHPMAPNGKWPSAVEMASLQVSCEPMPIPGIAPELWQVIDRAIQKTPSRRHQSAKAFVLALRNARLSTTPGRLGSRKHKVGPLFVPVVAGALCGMSASGLAQWVLWSRSQDTRATVHVEANVLGMPPGSTLVSGRPERSAVPVSVAQPTSAQALHLVAPESTSTPNDGATSSRTSCAAPTAQEGRPARRVGANSRAAPRPTQNENRPNPLNGYESAPGSHSPKDDLPASGL